MSRKLSNLFICIKLSRTEAIPVLVQKCSVGDPRRPPPNVSQSRIPHMRSGESESINSSCGLKVNACEAKQTASITHVLFWVMMWLVGCAKLFYTLPAQFLRAYRRRDRSPFSSHIDYKDSIGVSF